VGGGGSLSQRRLCIAAGAAQQREQVVELRVIQCDGTLLAGRGWAGSESRWILVKTARDKRGVKKRLR